VRPDRDEESVGMPDALRYDFSGPDNSGNWYEVILDGRAQPGCAGASFPAVRGLAARSRRPEWNSAHRSHRVRRESRTVLFWCAAAAGAGQWCRSPRALR